MPNIGRNNKKGGNPSTELYVLQLLGRAVTLLTSLVANSGLIKITEYLAASLGPGPEVIAHTITTQIYSITAKDSLNHEVVFSDLRWDDTNMYFTAPINVTDITFVITHKG